MNCAVSGCDRPVRGRGWCSIHYSRWRRYGDPLGAGGLQYVHRLTNVDPETRTATCANCGFVAVHRQGRSWKCASRRRTSRSRHHGLRADQRRALLEQHGNRCDICTSTAALRVDHDHQTGRIRGVLCQRCNAGISYFQDDPARLRQAACYLDPARGTSTSTGS